MNATTEPALVDRILDIGFAFWKSKALLCAVELGLFTELGEDRLEWQALAARLGLHLRGACDFFDALVALQLLDRHADGRYANRPDCAAYLDRNNPSYIGGALEHLNARLYPSWALLTQALRTGLPQSGVFGNGGYAALYAENVESAAFLNGMTGGSLMPARVLAASFPWQDYGSVMDVGAAQGGTLVEIARAHPHLFGGGFDLAQLEPQFARHVSRHGLSGRLRFHAGDFLVDELPPADVLIMGRILHNWDLATKKMLLTKASRALPQRGALIVFDSFIDDARRENAKALLASLNMLIETAGGSEYTASECVSWMLQCGFGETRIVPLAGGQMAVIAMKGAAAAPLPIDALADGSGRL
jgi:hypothetical protein